MSFCFFRSAVGVIWGLGFCLSVLSAGAAEESIPVPDAKAATEIDGLIKQLGDESYIKREGATKKLLGYGLPALKQIEAESENPDTEVRWRCSRISMLLREIDLERRLEAFAADVKGEKDHNLPAWDHFVALHGSSADARKVFVEIFKAEPELLKTMQMDGEKIGVLLDGRTIALQQMLQAQQTLSLGNVAGMLFAASQEGVKTSAQTQQIIYSFCYQQAFRNVISNGKQQPVVRSLLAKYIAQSEGVVGYQGLNMALQYNLEEGVIPARKLVKSRGAGHPSYMQLSLLTLAKMGGDEDLAIIEDLLNDKTVIANYRVDKKQMQAQVRDFALVSMLHLLAKDKERVKGTSFEKGDLKAFGFERLKANPIQLYSPQTICFESNEEREKVFKKWAELKDSLKVAEKKQNAKPNAPSTSDTKPEPKPQ